MAFLFYSLIVHLFYSLHIPCFWQINENDNGKDTFSSHRPASCYAIRKNRTVFSKLTIVILPLLSVYAIAEKVFLLLTMKRWKQKQHLELGHNGREKRGESWMTAAVTASATLAVWSFLQLPHEAWTRTSSSTTLICHKWTPLHCRQWSLRMSHRPIQRKSIPMIK